MSIVPLDPAIAHNAIASLVHFYQTAIQAQSECIDRNMQQIDTLNKTIEQLLTHADLSRHLAATAEELSENLQDERAKEALARTTCGTTILASAEALEGVLRAYNEKQSARRTVK
jgi:hypothetical protein